MTSKTKKRTRTKTLNLYDGGCQVMTVNELEGAKIIPLIDALIAARILKGEKKVTRSAIVRYLVKEAYGKTIIKKS